MTGIYSLLLICQKVCDAVSYLLDNIYIRIGIKLHRQIVKIPMGLLTVLLLWQICFSFVLKEML